MGCWRATGTDEGCVLGPTMPYGHDRRASRRKGQRHLSQLPPVTAGRLAPHLIDPTAQFLGAIETVSVFPRRLPQPVQQSFRSTSSTLVYGGRPWCSSAAATWARLWQTTQVATITCQGRKSSSLKAWRGGMFFVCSTSPELRQSKRVSKADAARRTHAGRHRPLDTAFSSSVVANPELRL
jgi:hypothetical protein